MEKRSQRFSIRKYSLGAASVLLGTAVVALNGPTVLADETAGNSASGTSQPTSSTTDNIGESSATADQETASVVSVEREDDTTTVTSQVTSSTLEDAKANAEQAGVQVEETEPQFQPSTEAAAADNQAQVQEVKAATEAQKAADADYAQKQAEYEAAVKATEAAIVTNTQIQADNAVAQAAYEQAQAAYEADLAQYEKTKAQYDTAKAAYEAAVAEKAQADARNAEAKAAYESALQVYKDEQTKYEVAKSFYESVKVAHENAIATNTQIQADNAAAQAAYEQAQAAYQAAQAQYEQDKAAYDKAVADKAAAEAQNTQIQADNQAARDAYNTAKAEYDAKKAEYDQAKAKYDADKAEYDAKVAEKEAADKANAEAEAKYNADKAQFEKDTIDYNTELLEYETALKQYKNAKEAHDKFLADTGLTQTKNAQELTFLREPNATHTIDGISSYLTKDAQQRLANDGGVKQYESNNLKEGDVVSTSPYANKEAEWLSVKVGDKFSVTYDGLSKSKMIVGGVEHDISKVIYRYEILNLPSNDGKGIAKVDADPTITLTVGASTDKADEPIRVAVDVEFYDGNGQMYDLSQRKAIVALNSLNHWDGAAYANGSDKPRELVVEAKDADGNTVRGTWDPYADGSSPSLNNGAPVVKSGYADFDGETVTISESNPLKIIAQKAGWNGSWIVEKETTVLENYVYASGGGNGHSTGLDEYKFGDQDDVLGTYRIDPTSGLITFTPKKKFQSIKHQEFVNIGDKEFVAIPNSSVTYNPDTKEVTSEKDNQYIEHGAVFNGETTPTLRGWDDADSPYLYYGGAGVKMTDGHLVFTANGANADGQPTVYWFAINSNVGFPKDPGDAPKAPEKPTPPMPPTPKTVTVPTPPTEPTPPTPPTAPEVKPTVDVPSVPDEPTPPTPPTAPEVKPTVDVPSVPDEPTPPTTPTPPIYDIVEVPADPGEEPKAPTPPIEPNYKPTVDVPEIPEAPERKQISVKWHKNLIVEKFKDPKPEKPALKEPVTPVKVADPAPVSVTSEKTLPQTGDSNSYGLALFGMGMTAFAAATLLGSLKKRKED